MVKYLVFTKDQVYSMKHYPSSWLFDEGTYRYTCRDSTWAKAIVVGKNPPAWESASYEDVPKEFKLLLLLYI